eukprot:CAMPEP_0206219806 /NCGR_PEP_ID=MMETSP0047_2-20121206/4513_1 /ASSEMBLY_ACC=CAM_ASM_000192 /TAXON_ID=195065 /ORGANISM="Chroomonas mesostigmatica_cf, Strain CCMP1168" /LENGTH=60 /DNA_ID=CAMNT_0053642369 /DNA_START=69 /DNA_END=251 /DNA_ORIENTATION=+
MTLVLYTPPPPSPQSMLKSSFALLGSTPTCSALLVPSLHMVPPDAAHAALSVATLLEEPG